MACSSAKTESTTMALHRTAAFLTKTEASIIRSVLVGLRHLAMRHFATLCSAFYIVFFFGGQERILPQLWPIRHTLYRHFSINVFLE